MTPITAAEASDQVSADLIYCRLSRREGVDVSDLRTVESLGSQFLKLELRGNVAYCTIDRLHKRNALTGMMYAGIRRAVRLLDETPDVGALVLTGVGDTFSVGAT